MTTAIDMTAGDAKANWPRASALYAWAVSAVILGPAAVIIAVWHVVNHPEALGWWLAEYAAGFGLLCVAAGAGLKYGGDREDRYMDEAVAAAEAAGKSDGEIFDLLHGAAPRPQASKLQGALHLAAILALAGVAAWGLERLVA